MQDAAKALVLLAQHASQRAAIQMPDVAFVGGLMRSATLSDNVDRRLHELMAQATRVAPARDAAEGALLLAYRPA